MKGSSNQRTQTAFEVLKLVSVDSLSLPKKPLPTDAEAVQEQNSAKKMWDNFFL